jgi:hypothetical protein
MDRNIHRGVVHHDSRVPAGPGRSVQAGLAQPAWMALQLHKERGNRLLTLTKALTALTVSALMAKATPCADTLFVPAPLVLLAGFHDFDGDDGGARLFDGFDDGCATGMLRSALCSGPATQEDPYDSKVRCAQPLSSYAGSSFRQPGGLEEEDAASTATVRSGWTAYTTLALLPRGPWLAVPVSPRVWLLAFSGNALRGMSTDVVEGNSLSTKLACKTDAGDEVSSTFQLFL